MGMLMFFSISMRIRLNCFAGFGEAIKAAVKGEFYLCTETTIVFIDEYLHGPDQSRGAKELSVRERKVVELLAGGMSSKEIAYDLDLSVKTVDACRRKLMKKLGIDSVADIVKYAIREGLSSLE
jgi:DNA-binding NarL/FixJ family response regulator